MPEAVNRKEGEAVALAPAEFGRYQVFATLGRGGMADVYLAVARGPMGFNKLVVVKRLRAHLAEEPGFRDMFLDEARLAARLNHPNVIQSYEVGETNGAYFIAMEYLDGQPLNRILAELRRKNEPLDPGVGVRIVVDALTGLGHAHDLRDYDGTPLHIIHRDVSPHNVFVTYEGQVKLVDFGIAKAALSRAETEVGVLKGKVAYMAPEQAMGGPIDARADLFAMGIVLWELTTGRPLFTGDNAANTLHRLMNEPMPLPSTIVPGTDPRIEAIIMRALEKDPAKRYPNARELREALESWLRESGRNVRSEDIGKLVGALFEEKRGRVQREIQKHMSEIARPASRAHLMSLTSIEQMERAGQNPNSQLANLANDSGSSMVSLPGSRSTTATSATGVEAEKRRKRRAVMVALLALLGVLGLAGVFLFLRPKGPQKDAAGPGASATTGAIASIDTMPPTPPSASAAPPLAPTASVVAVAPTATATPTPGPRTNPPRTPRGGRTAPAPAPRPQTPAAPAPAAGESGPSGFLTFDTYPWTRVSEGGRVLGTTPLVHVPLSPGSHTLTLDNADQGLHQSFSVSIKSGETVTKRLGLK